MAADQVRREFFLKRYLARNLTSEDLRSWVATRRHDPERLNKTFQEAKDKAASPQEIWVVDYALAMCTAETDWLKQIEANIAHPGNFHNPSEELIQSSA